MTEADDDAANRRGDAADQLNARDQLRGQLTAIARQSAVGRATGDGLTPRVLLEVLGGWLGIVEALLPVIAFIVLFSLTSNLVLAVTVPAGLSAIALAVRLVRRQPIGGALSGMFGILVSGVLAMTTGKGADFFLIGLWTNAIYGAGLLITMLVGWPAIGIVVGYVTGRGTAWRRSRRAWLAMQVLTGVWVGVFALRLVVQVPLYLEGATEALGVARVIMGIPLFAVALIVTAVVARMVVGRMRAASDRASSTPAVNSAPVGPGTNVTDPPSTIS